jgi:hypothetical protein
VNTKLLTAIALGDEPASVRFGSWGNTGKLGTYFQGFKMADVIVISVHVAATNYESITLTFGKFEFDYRPIKPDGSKVGRQASQLLRRLNHFRSLRKAILGSSALLSENASEQGAEKPAPIDHPGALAVSSREQLLDQSIVDCPFNLVRVANIDIGIDHDDRLGTLSAWNRSQDSVACLSHITLLHRYNDIKKAPVAGESSVACRHNGSTMVPVSLRKLHGGYRRSKICNMMTSG